MRHWEWGSMDESHQEWQWKKKVGDTTDAEKEERVQDTAHRAGPRPTW